MFLDLSWRANHVFPLPPAFLIPSRKWSDKNRILLATATETCSRFSFGETGMWTGSIRGDAPGALSARSFDPSPYSNCIRELSARHRRLARWLVAVLVARTFPCWISTNPTRENAMQTDRERPALLSWLLFSSPVWLCFPTLLAIR
jgi:hypothetical protein